MSTASWTYTVHCCIGAWFYCVWRGTRLAGTSGPFGCADQCQQAAERHVARARATGHAGRWLRPAYPPLRQPWRRLLRRDPSLCHAPVMYGPDTRTGEI